MTRPFFALFLLLGMHVVVLAEQRSEPVSIGAVDPQAGAPMTPADAGAHFYRSLKPVGRILNLMDEGWIVWGCAPIYDDDGRVHVFFARWKHGGNWKRIDWVNTGQIVHAVADRPEGPYAVREVVLRGRGGDHWDGSGVINPQIHKVDGKYVLLYTGINIRKHHSLRGQGVGMAIADSLNGPWRLVSDAAPIIAPSTNADAFDSFLCNNPALVVSPERKYYLYYKGRSLADEARRKAGKGGMIRRIGLAIADRVEGPYVKFKSNPVLNDAPKDYEDPYVWYEDGRYKMLLHDLSLIEHGAGLYVESIDGFHWSKPVQGYPSTRSTFGVKQRLETPILLMKDGRPAYLFNNRGGHSHEKIFSGFVWKIEK